MTRIGFVGVGAISGIYLENITKRFKDIEIIGVCDLIRERAERAGRNPKTGEVVTVPACKYLAFVSAKAVKEKLN